ncbi:MAG: hypothetical protein AAFQ73_16855 [Pseudomonadota bacterium]
MPPAILWWLLGGTALIGASGWTFSKLAEAFRELGSAGKILVIGGVVYVAYESGAIKALVPKG